MPVKHYLDLSYHHIHVVDNTGELLFAFRNMVSAANAMVFYRLHNAYVVDVKAKVPTKWPFQQMRSYATIH